MRCERKHARVLLGVLALLWGAAPARAADIPSWLPRYDLDIRLDVGGHEALVRERVTWTNRHQRPATELVFNAHSHYKIPNGETAFLAKSVEILRMSPGEALDFEGHACEIQRVILLGVTGPAAAGDRNAARAPLHAAPSIVDPQSSILDLLFQYRADNQTALEVTLPRPVAQGESVTVELQFRMRLPQKQGRWGQWKGVTYLSNWLPVLAYYDDAICGWHPTPFIPWHQPFFNEAGVYNVRVTLPCDQQVASTGSVVAVQEVGNGLKQVEITACAARDFALLCSARFQEFTGQAGPVRVRCLAFPEHEYYARRMVRYACEAIPVYCHWFGPYPYPEFTIVESYFGWNGNECAGLIMIDERIFDMPHVGDHYVDYLISHETSHQWWYNVVGTNGHCETWMDEGLATYFSYRLMAIKYGKNDPLLRFPRGLEWLPNIPRQTYHYSGLYGTLGRGEECATVGDLSGFGHIINLFSMTYDKGSKVVGMIEDRLGEAAFFDFMRLVYARYQFRILRVADFQRELEGYTGRSWDEFFQHWLYGAGLTDWCVQRVKIEDRGSRIEDRANTAQPCDPQSSILDPRSSHAYRVTVLLRQKAEYNEQTVLGICLDGGDGYQVRIPIMPEVASMDLDDPPAHVEMLPDNRVRVEVVLPCKPTQIAVDPDQVLVDRNPANNYWKRPVRWRFVPLYTQLEDTDLTTAYDRWNFTAGPWVYGAAYDDPWYTRSTRMGVRAGLYRTQEFFGGGYVAYRGDARDLVAGADGLWDHLPWPHTQIGFNVETGLTNTWWGEQSDRGVIFGRYVFKYGSSLYLPPMEYVELYGAIENNELPFPRETVPGAFRFDHQTMAGLHFHLDYLTPYWDPEGGFRFDVTYASGLSILGEQRAFNRVEAQFSQVKKVPDGLGWLSETRVAGRLYGAVGLPKDGEYFPLGGSTLFRGFDLMQRQGSMVWVGSLEWRAPLARGLTWDCVDHMVGLRNIWAATFYDAGDVYLKGHSVGGLVHDAGVGLRLDMAWFSFVERTILRLDVAKALNANTPTQFWLAVEHPF
ncbi:MAG TPA: M1 family aminopeptidase [Gemmataceae bacterium]|nr:M1 family aminopeptidase [Gemmataceae bacterium]